MREIRVEIEGQFLRKSSKYAGVQGEGNVTKMKLVFDESWQGFGKRIIWRDAMGLEPTSVVLGDQQRTGEGLLDYTVYIPPEPLKAAGWCSFTIEGYSQQDGVSSVALTVSDRLEVKAGEYGAPAEPTASQTLQLQAEIDGLLAEVGDKTSQAANANQQAQQAKTQAQGSADQAAQAMQAAQASQNIAENKANQAGEDSRQAQSAAVLSKSWAQGGTGVREDEETNNAKYWSVQAQSAAGGGVTTFNGRSGTVLPQSGDYTKAQVGLGNVDNTSDMSKPVSTAMKTALDGKADAQAMQTALDGKAGVSHGHDASDVSGGKLGGMVQANSTAAAVLGNAQVRNIYAGTADLEAGVSALSTGTIYLVYEE